MPRDHRAAERMCRAAIVAAAVVTTILAACSGAASPHSLAVDPALPPAVESAQREARYTGAFVAQTLVRERRLYAPITVSKTITQRGGKIDIADAGFTLEVPPGAFADKSMTFTITAHAGAIAYDFEPQGAVFLVPLMVRQRFDHDYLESTLLPAGFIGEIAGGYFSDSTKVDDATGVAVVQELLPTTFASNGRTDELSFPIRHLSGYAVTVGRSSAAY